MIFLPQFEELKFMIGLEVTQVCLGQYDFQLHFFDKKDSPYVSLVMFQSEIVKMDGKNLISVMDYAALSKFLGKKIIDLKTEKYLLVIVFENGHIDIELKANGYESITISHGKDVIVI